MTSTGSAERPNPYIGPRAFTENDRQYFYGRDQEIAVLRGQVVARRASLFYAQSGAGKSSLLRAGLVPELKGLAGADGGPVRRRMMVLGVATVGGAVPARVAGQVDNVFVYSVLSSLRPESAPEALAGLKLAAGLAPLLDSADEDVLLIIDQFEELFSSHPEHWLERRPFFEQLQEALTLYPVLRLLFTMREDFIAELTPFTHLLPDDLRYRYRLEQLDYRSAVAAVTRPAEQAGRRYADGVAEELVDNLRRVQGRRDTNDGETLGPYVEPVHLQIVCRELWHELPLQQSVIEASDVQAFGDVDDALTGFYEGMLAQAMDQSAGMTERELREWLEKRLITRARTRALVHSDEVAADGPAEPALEVFADAYLIRAVERGGERYYELAHDRMVEPVLQANQLWRETHYNPIVAARERWQAAGETRNHLLLGRQLAEAEAYADENPHDVSAEDRVFLEKGQLEEIARRRRRWFLAGGAVFLVLTALVLTALTLFALEQRAEARRQQEVAERQAELASSRELAAAAVASLATDPERGLLLALEAAAITDTLEAETALRRALQAARVVQRLGNAQPAPPSVADDGSEIGTGLPAAYTAVTYSQDGALLAAVTNLGEVSVWQANADGVFARLRVWDTTARAEGAGYGVTSSAPDTATLFRVSAARNQVARAVPPGQAGAGREAADEQQIYDLAFSPDGRLLVTVGADDTAVVWSVERRAADGEAPILVLPADDPATAALEGHAAAVYAVAFSPDGTRIATGSADRIVRLWDAQSGALLQEFFGHGEAVTSVSFSPDGTLLASGGADASVRIWQSASAEPLQTLEQHTDVVEAVAFSPAFNANGGYLLSGSRDKTAILSAVSADGQQLTPVATLYDHTDTVAEVAFSANGNCVATASGDRTARVFDLQTVQPLRVLAGHTDFVLSVAFMPVRDEQAEATPAARCGQRLATASADGSVLIWNIGPSYELDTFAGHAAPVESAVFDAPGERIASGDDQGAVAVWDAQSGEVRLAWQAHPERVNRVAFSPDGRLLATASWDGTGAVWDAATGERRYALTEHAGFDRASDRVESVAFDAAGARLATAGGDGLVLLWDVTTGEPITSLFHGGHVYGVTFSPDGRYLVSTGQERALVWSLESEDVVATLEDGQQEVVYDAAFSPDGRLLATVSWDNTVKLYDVPAFSRLDALPLHADRVYGVSFSPDSHLLATSSGDGTLQVWDVGAGELAHTLPGPELNSLDFHPDGQTVAVGGEDGTVRLYTLDRELLLEIARTRLTRALRDEECRQYLHQDSCP